jgi:type IV fimbrial biogenesis protein FimT
MKITTILKKSRAQGAGFSLVELMVTLSIGSILLAIGVPSMTNLIRDARLASQSDLLVSTLNMARMEAIKQRTNFKVCPATASGTAPCSGTAADWYKGWAAVPVAADGTTPLGTVISRRVEAKSGLIVTTAATGVEFSGTLGSAAAVTSFTLCVTGRIQHLVDVSLSGRVSKRIGTTVCS